MPPWYPILDYLASKGPNLEIWARLGTSESYLEFPGVHFDTYRHSTSHLQQYITCENFKEKLGTVLEKISAEVYFSQTRENAILVEIIFMHFFSGTKHPKEDNPNLYYWVEMTGLHTNI